MDFNPRATQHFRGSSQNGRGKKREEDSDAFMRLSDKEIAGCITDIGIPFSPADLQRPNPQQIQLIFECFAELLMNATRETITPAMRAAAEDVCGEHADIIPTDTRNLMGFYVSLRKLLFECGISDFSFNDLHKPTHDRLVKIFSYVINLVRFRESQTATIDQYFNKAETTKQRIEAVFAENQRLDAELAEMKRVRRATEGAVKEKVRRNEELKARLLELKKGQEKVAERLERAKADKGRLSAVLEDKTTATLACRQEAEKLRPYVLQSPAALQASLAELSTALQTDRAQTESLERRSRALQTSLDAFAAVAADATSCVRLLDDVAAELRKEDEEAARAARHKDALSERGNNVREVERTEALLQRQLAKWHERTDKLRRASEDRADAARLRMDEMRQLHRRLADERADKARDMERRRVRIEQTEKKMADLKDNIENEVHNAHDEFLKMDSHIRLYITEMEQSV
ncbi:MAG: hypothetical protein M1825_003133 [Sarcosagium campestre]|nr:MAG: hypothetical protein M1825_003133 [Sarcosagium campestre]